MPTLQLAIDARQSRQGADEHNRAVDSVKRSSAAAGTQVERFDDKLKKAGITAKTVAKAVAGVFISLSAGAFFLDAINTLGKYEKTLNTVRGVSRATAEDFALLQKTARELGATTSFSAAEAGEGLLFLARAGFSATESAKSLPTVLNLAKAAAIELGSSADILSNTLSQFGLNVDQAGRAADVLINTSNRANTDVTQLAAALQKAGPVAAALGIPIEDVAAAIGKLGDAAIQGSEAGTSISGILAGLLKPSEQADKALATLGLTFDDISAKNNTLSESLRKLRDSGLDATTALQLFGRENFAAALILTNTVDGIDELARSNREAAGETDRLAKIMGLGLLANLASLRSAVEELYLSLGDRGLLNGLTLVVAIGTDVVRVLAGMDSTFITFDRTARILAATIQGLLVTLTLLTGLKVASFFVSAAQAAGGFAAALKAVGIALATSLGPLGVAAVAIGALTAAFLYFKDQTITVGDTAVTISDLVGAAIDVMKERALIAFEAIVLGAKLLYETIGINASVFIEALGRATNNFFDGLFNKATGTISQILKFVRVSIDFTIDAVVALGRTIGAVLDRYVDPLENIFNFTVDPSFESLANVKDSLKKALNPGTLFTEIKTVWTTDFENNFLDEFGNTVKGMASNVKDSVVEMFDLALQDPAFKELWERFQATGGVNPLASLDVVLEAARQRAIKRAEEATAAGVEDTDAAKVLADTLAQIKEVENALGDVKPAAEGAGDAVVVESDRMIQALKGEIKILEETKRGREYARELTAFGAQALKDYEGNQESVNAAVETYTALLQKASALEARSELDNLNRELELELSLIGQTSEARERSLKLREAEIYANQAYGEGTEEARQALEDYNQTLDKIDSREQFTAIVDQGVESLADGLTDATLGAESLSDALEGVVKELERAIVKQLLLNLVSGVANSFTADTNPQTTPSTTNLNIPAAANNNALGGVFDITGTKRFAMGGITSGPEYFPMANGQTGLRGERGAEAVLPLSRDANGRLGVLTGAGSSGSDSGPSQDNRITNNVTMNFPPGTKPDDRFKRTTSQTLSKFQRGR